MTDSERLRKIEARQEALIASVNGLCGVMDATNATLGDVVMLLKEPPSSDLPDMIRALVQLVQNLNLNLTTNTLQIETLGGTVGHMGARISALRDTITKATSG
jgi:hypothetical protein